MWGALFDRMRDPHEHENLWQRAVDAEAAALAGRGYAPPPSSELELARVRRRLEGALLRWR